MSEIEELQALVSRLKAAHMLAGWSEDNIETMINLGIIKEGDLEA